MKKIGGSNKVRTMDCEIMEPSMLAKSYGGGKAFHATERRQVPKVLMHAHLQQ